MEDFEFGTKNKDSEPVEFEFGKKRADLVFEFVKQPDPEPSAAPVLEKREEAPATLDVFDAAEKEERIVGGFESAKIWTTYVPRFTDASENYRMKNDPRPRPVGIKSEVQTDLPVTEELPAVDPTAEIEEDVEGAVIVDMSRASEPDSSDTLNVYKFSENEGGESEKAERTLEDEQREINSLFSRPVVVEETPVVEPESPEVEAKEYELPDPDSEDSHMVDFSECEPVEDNPAGARDGADSSVMGEFTLPIQRDGFKDRFLDTLMSVKIRLGATLLFSLALLAFEIFYYFGAFGKTLFSLPITPVTPAVLDYLAAAVTFALSLPELVRAFKYLVLGKLLPELMLPVSFTALTLYFAALLGNGNTPSYPMYGFLFSVMALATVLASYYRTDADFTAFKLISKNSEKQILDKKMTRELPEENMALDGIVDEYKSVLARFFRASFITDFFKSTAKTSETTSRSAVLIAVSFGAALVSGSVALFLMDGLISAASVFTFVLMLASPTFAILSYKIAYRDSQRAIVGEDTTAVGETAYDEFSKVDVIAFDDTEIFGPDDVNLKRFMLYGDRDNMEKAMRQMCSLFSVVGGPLAAIFAGALDNRVRHAPAGNPEIETDGLSGDVGGSRISAGTEAYMRRHGVAIPEGAQTSEMGIDTTKIMYASENGEVYAKFYIRYSFSEEFTMLLPSLKEEGITPLVYTRDPNVSNELFRTLTAGADSVRVMKKLSPKLEEEKLYGRVSAEIVTYGEKINAISALLAAKRHKKLVERLRVSELYAMGAGTALALLISILGIKGVPMLVFGLWHIAWCVVLRFVSKRALIRDNEE